MSRSERGPGGCPLWLQVPGPDCSENLQENQTSIEDRAALPGGDLPPYPPTHTCGRQALAEIRILGV